MGFCPSPELGRYDRGAGKIRSWQLAAKKQAVSPCQPPGIHADLVPHAKLKIHGPNRKTDYRSPVFAHLGNHRNWGPRCFRGRRSGSGDAGWTCIRIVPQAAVHIRPATLRSLLATFWVTWCGRKGLKTVVLHWGQVRGCAATNWAMSFSSAGVMVRWMFLLSRPASAHS